MQIHQGIDVLIVPNWAEQLANLTKTAWSGKDGKCYFPYLPLTTPEFWEDCVKSEILSDTMIPFVLEHGGHIIAHAALVQKENGWECGRWVAYHDAPKGSVSRLVIMAIEFANAQRWQVWVECTQAHTASQKICRRAELRFAGIGFLNEIDGIFWDIIYFDNATLPDFDPQIKILADPLGKKLAGDSNHLQRLRTISQILSVERGGEIPPSKFHILPELEETIRKIISSNL